MANTLYETLRLIDPYVKLNDGVSIRTVEQVLFALDPADPEEYALFSDHEGRLLIYRLAPGGHPLPPAAFIEEKVSATPLKKRRAKTPPA
jgi:hypothetical protein